MGSWRSPYSLARIPAPREHPGGHTALLRRPWRGGRHLHRTWAPVIAAQVFGLAVSAASAAEPPPSPAATQAQEAAAQAQEAAAQAQEPTAHVEPAPGDFALRPALTLKQLAFIIYGHDKENRAIATYRPNSTYFWKADVGYRNFGLSVGAAIPGTHKDEALYGRTSANDIQLYYYGRRVGIDVYRQRYSGYYLGSSGAGDGGWGPAGGGIREDLRQTSLGANAYYIFSDRFSINAAMRQGEIQRKTGYSYLLGATASHYEVSASRPLLPASHPPRLAQYAQYTGGRYLNVAVMPGFAFTYVPKSYPRCFMTVLALMGLGATRAEVALGSKTQTQITDNYKVNAKYSAGFNGEHFFINGSVVLDLSATATISKSTLNVGSGLILLEAAAGARL